MASQPDSPGDQPPEANVSEMTDAMEDYEDAGWRSPGVYMTPEGDLSSVEVFRRDHDLDSVLGNLSLSSFNCTVLSSKASIAGEDFPECPRETESPTISSRQDVPAEAVTQLEGLNPVSLQADEEPVPDVPLPTDQPPESAFMSTPVSQKIPETGQVVPGAPLPQVKGIKPPRDKTSFYDGQTMPLPDVRSATSLQSTHASGYTKPLIQTASAEMKVPALASMLSTALELATLNKVSPLFERTETNLVPGKQQSVCKVSMKRTFSHAGMRRGPVSINATNESVQVKESLCSGSDSGLSHEEIDVRSAKAAREEIQPSSDRRRKVGVVILKHEKLSLEEEDQHSEVKAAETTPLLHDLAREQSNHETEDTIKGRHFSLSAFQMTSTPKCENEYQRNQAGASADCNTPTIPKILPPWRRSEQEDVSRVTPSQALTTATELPPTSPVTVDTRGPADGGKRSKVSCALCPDWCLPVEAVTASTEGAESSRKVSVVNRSKRKLTPYTTGVEGLLIPTDPVQSTLEKLASFVRKCAITPPLYIVHPITGTVKILQELAKGLEVRCYGVQRTHQTPETSVELMAKFYCEALIRQQKTGSYNLAGYSYGGMVVFEMARQLQQAGRQVALLVMLDGSPDYVKSQVSAIKRGLIPESSPERVMAVVESHLLLYFMGMYGPVHQPEMVRAMLEELPSQEDRVAVAVGVTLGTLQVSSMARSRWLGLRSKMDQGRQDSKPKLSVSHVTQDVISLRRQQKGIAFLRAANIAEEYEVNEEHKFVGDIHLVRIQSLPELCGSLSPDYNLKALCTGCVHVHYVEGEHESMMESPHVQSVIEAVSKALQTVMD